MPKDHGLECVILHGCCKKKVNRCDNPPLAGLGQTSMSTGQDGSALQPGGLGE